VGDLHFSQGDGEITFCGAIEMAGWVHMKVTLIKGGMAKYGIKNPIFKPSVITPRYDDYLIFEGISVDEAGKQYYLDVNVAYRQACLNAIEYLKKFGYSGAQAYSILGTAPVQGHISGVVDVPNSCATLVAADRHLRLRHQPECFGADQAHRRQDQHAAVARPALIHGDKRHAHLRLRLPAMRQLRRAALGLHAQPGGRLPGLRRPVGAHPVRRAFAGADGGRRAPRDGHQRARAA
jgi:hypothetical protein